VRTRNANLYLPVTRSVTVAPKGVTPLNVLVAEPPSVKARFVEGGKEHRGAFVNGYQGDHQVLGFRAKDRAYIDPGTYEFRSKPNADNELSVVESFADGDRKEIIFEMLHTVHAVIKMVATDSGIDFRTGYELWQDGERKYKVHWSNGVRALPGAYDLRLPLRLTPYLHQGLVITVEDDQKHRIEVPVGYVTIYYQNADGSPTGQDKRCTLERKTEAGRWVKDTIGHANRRTPLVPGEYHLKGWSHLGEFNEVFFAIEVGEEKELFLREKGGE
jgi:hypothetical protein